MNRSFFAVPIAACLCAYAIAFMGGCAASPSDDARAAASFAETHPGYEDDFYEAVNKDTFAAWEIPSTEAYIDNFSVLRTENRSRLRGIMEKAAGDASAEPGSDGRNVGALWATALDSEARDAGGLGIAQDFVDEVDAAQSKEQLLDALVAFDREYGFHSFFGINVDVDAQDSDSYVYMLERTDTGLDREEWYSQEPATQERVRLYGDLLCTLWEQNGAAPDVARAKVESVTAAMRELAASSLTVDEQYDPAKAYSAHVLSDLDGLYGDLLSTEEVCGLYDASPSDKVVVSDEGLLQATAAFLAAADLPLLKDYVKSRLFMDLSGYSTAAAQQAALENRKERLGLEETTPLEDELVDAIGEDLAFQCGRLYEAEHFQHRTREDIQAMIDDIVSVYEKRMDDLAWMGEETKAAAKIKLAAIKANIGVPDSWPQDRYVLELARPEEGGLYVDNILAIHKAVKDADLARMGTPVDKHEWLMAPQEVNAYYDPKTNSITLMAGILQPPFYDPSATPEQNLGRIGMVIAHEITHAFDSDGSQYDENGNLRDWWTEEDAAQFEALAQQVVDYYAGQEVAGMAVNGEQTLSENIADLGAVACITEVAKERGYDLQEVYVAYGQNWAEEIRDEYLAELIATNTHAPEKVRANAVLSATDGFYEAFGIEEGDGMYVPPELRPGIW